MRCLFVVVLAAFGLVSVVRAEEKGPHDGALYEAAKHKYHIEIKVDAAAKSVTAYILDEKAKTPVPIKAKTIALKIKGVKEAITLSGVATKGSESFTEFKGAADLFGSKLDLAAITLVAKVEDNKPALTFELDD